MAYGKKIEKNRGWYMFGILFIFFAIIYLAFNSVDGWRKYKESTKRLEASVLIYQELTQQYEELSKAKALEKSSTGYEMQVRSKFDLARPDENVVFITSEKEAEPVIQEKGIQKMLHTVKNFFN
jgi:hypothetical protein